VALQLNSLLTEYAPQRVIGDAQGKRQRSAIPTRHSRGRQQFQLRQDSITQFDAVLGRFARPGFVTQSSDAVRSKASPPLPGRVWPHADFTGNVVIAPTLQARQYDARPLGKANLATSTSRQSLKLAHNLRRTRQCNRYSCHFAPNAGAIGAS
jgi:hypothetical protein